MEYSDALCRGYLTHVQPVNNGAELTLTIEQSSVPIVLNGEDVRLEEATGYEDRYVRPIEIGQQIGPYGDVSLSNDVFQQVFKPSSPNFADWPQIEMNKKDDDKLMVFLHGIEGNPLLVSGSYSRMLYFSVIVMTTVGFGDVVPLTPLARLATGIQAIFGVTLFGLFLRA